MIKGQLTNLQTIIQLARDIIGFGLKTSPVAGAMVLTALGGAVWWFLTLRWSPPDQVGYFVATLGITTLIAEAANIGIGYVVIRHFASAGDLSSPLIRTGLSVITTAAIAGAGLFIGLNHILAILPFPSQAQGFVLIFIAVLGIAWYNLTDNLLLVSEKRWGLFVRAGLTSIGRLALLVVFALSNHLELLFLIASYFLPFIIASIAVCVYLRGAVFNGSKKNFFLRGSQLNRFVPYAIQSYLGNIVAAITPNVLPVIVIWRLGSIVAAQYGAMWSIAGLVMLVPTAISLTTLSTAARGEANSKKLISQGAWLIASLSVPTIVLILAFAHLLLPYLGSTYSQLNIYHLAPLLFGVLCFSLTAQMYSKARLVDYGPRLIIAGQCLQLVLVVGFAFLLIVIWGLVGVSLAWLIGAAITLVFIYIFGSIYLDGFQRPIGKTMEKIDHSVISDYE
jgi:O-antigen/teichoic acid export membrane protein